MPEIIEQWLKKFLGKRSLERPDGRALYAYRCSEQEYFSLVEALRGTHWGENAGNAVRAFVLYAAEWWQRQYDGGPWAWEPLLRSVGWDLVLYTDLYAPTALACRWWGIELVRLPAAGTRYLGTFACQGGLPLGLIGDTDNHVARYLRAVLKHTVEYGRFVDDPIELARDQQHLLPRTLRRDYVFRLASDLIGSVIDLQADAQGEDPIDNLDQARPDWRDQMPLNLDNQTARNLLAVLFRDAAQEAAHHAQDFRVERFLRRTGVGWRLGARVRLPASISLHNLARQLRVPDETLADRHRLQVRIVGKRVHVLGTYALRSDDDFVLLRDGLSAELWDEEAAGEIRLTFLSGTTIGTPVVPHRGAQLEDLPWCFRPESQEEHLFVGEGKVSNRSPELLALVPVGCEVDRMNGVDQLGERSLGRELWRISEPAKILTGGGFCLITPGAGQVSDEEYRLVGLRCYDMECSVPLFKGAPRLQISRPEAPPLPIQDTHIKWWQPSGEWQAQPTTHGHWEMRHVAADGELRFRGRVGVLPDGFALILEPGQDVSEGKLVFQNAGEVQVTAADADVRLNLDEHQNGAVSVAVTARDPANPPVLARLKLRWPGGRELPVQVRFPGRGGRFLSDGKPVAHPVSVSELYGLRATVLTPYDYQRFWIRGDLDAPDLGDLGLAGITHFRALMAKSRVGHELPVIDIRSMVDLLLSASFSSEATVALSIVDRANSELDKIKVFKFAAVLRKEPDMSLFTIVPDIEIDEGTELVCEALPVAHPEGDPVPFNLIGPSNRPVGFRIPDSLNLQEPWLVVVRHDNQMRVRPVEVGDYQHESCEVGEESATGLAAASRFLDPSQRSVAISKALALLLVMEDEKQLEDDWGFLINTLLRAQGLPAAVNALLPCLVKNPQLLVRCLFRVDSGIRRMLWELEAELPFSWLLVRRDIWWQEAQTACTELGLQLTQAGIENGDAMARESVCSIFDEGADRLSSLAPLAADIAVRLEGGLFSEEWAREIRNGYNAEVNDMLVRHMDNFPAGYARHDWVEELGQGEVLNTLWRNEAIAFGERQAIFDTPVAAACCCFICNATAKTAYLTKHVRAQDPEWFDLAYSATWVRLAMAVDQLDDGAI